MSFDYEKAVIDLKAQIRACGDEENAAAIDVALLTGGTVLEKLALVRDSLGKSSPNPKWDKATTELAADLSRRIAGLLRKPW